MAKPKIDVLIKRHPNSEDVFLVYRNDWAMAAVEIKGIEGVSYVTFGATALIVEIDPRYDIGEVEQEITDLLTAQVPDVFREEE